jgi:hypothetical protein
VERARALESFERTLRARPSRTKFSGADHAHHSISRLHCLIAARARRTQTARKPPASAYTRFLASARAELTAVENSRYAEAVQQAAAAGQAFPTQSTIPASVAKAAADVWAGMDTEARRAHVQAAAEEAAAHAAAIDAEIAEYAAQIAAAVTTGAAIPTGTRAHPTATLRRCRQVGLS